MGAAAATALAHCGEQMRLVVGNGVAPHAQDGDVAADVQHPAYVINVAESAVKEDGESGSSDGPLYELTVATRGPGGEAKVLVSYGDGRLVLTCQECGHLADVEDGPGALPPLVADALDHQRTSHNHAKEAS